MTGRAAPRPRRGRRRAVDRWIADLARVADVDVACELDHGGRTRWRRASAEVNGARRRARATRRSPPRSQSGRSSGRGNRGARSSALDRDDREHVVGIGRALEPPELQHREVGRAPRVAAALALHVPPARAANCDDQPVLRESGEDIEQGLGISGHSVERLRTSTRSCPSAARANGVTTASRPDVSSRCRDVRDGAGRTRARSTRRPRSRR